MSFPFPVLPALIRDDFRFVGEPIGEGNFSTIFCGRSVKFPKDVALKVVCKSRVERLKKEHDVLMEKHVLKRYGRIEYMM